MEAKEKRRIVEALILSSAEPLSAEKIAEIIPYCKEGQAKDLVNELNTEYSEQDRAFEIWEVAGGYQLRTRAEFSGYLQKLQKERALRLSQAALETLAIIAYRQPVTRAEIEEVRGVDAGAVAKSLLERHLIRIAGQREVPGRPMLYATTRRFLEVFGLDRIKDLPTLRELDELAREQGLLETPAENNALAEGAVPAEDGEAQEGAPAVEGDVTAEESAGFISDLADETTGASVTDLADVIDIRDAATADTEEVLAPETDAEDFSESAEDDVVEEVDEVVDFDEAEVPADGHESDSTEADEEPSVD